MESGLQAILAFVGAAIFALAAGWRASFAILGLCSILTGLFYGWIWVLERKAIRNFQELYGDLGIYPPDHLPGGWHSIVKDFQPQVLIFIWGLGLMIFLWRFMSELDHS